MPIMDFKSFKTKYQKVQVNEYANSVSIKPLVSVCVQTYQHANYIKECLDSVLCQSTNFDFEIIVGDDESADGTTEICLEYAKKYPNKIRFFTHKRKNNIAINDNPSGRFNMLYNLYSANGKYIALCEGDDYWTDPLKLQKQVDFLEASPDYGLCLHNVQQLNTFDNLKSTIIPGLKVNTDISLNEYVLSNRTATCSIVFKASYFFPIKHWFNKLPFGDLGVILSVLKASNEKAHVLQDVMGVYRIHEKGIHGNLHKNNSLLIKAYKQHLQFTKIIRKELLGEKKYEAIVLQKYINTYAILTKLYKKEEQQVKAIESRFLKKYYSFF
jgi:glycosyltransferase involved in cell wall biosynthesis